MRPHGSVEAWHGEHYFLEDEEIRKRLQLKWWQTCDRHPKHMKAKSIKCINHTHLINTCGSYRRYVGLAEDIQR